MRVAQTIDFDTLEVSTIFAAWMRGSPALDAFLPRRPRDLAALVDAARRHSVEVDAGLRAGVIAAIDESLTGGRSEAQAQALEAFAREDCIAIVTGQQPCLFGGPLYVVHKVATACRLAKDLRAALLAEGIDRPVVPVFWNHDEDHDWGEANHVAFVNPALDVQRVRLRLPSTGTALGKLELGPEIDRAVDEARDLIVQTECGLAELEAFRPRSERETLATSLTAMLGRHFASEGLLILEATRLGGACRSMLRAWHREAGDARSVQHARGAELLERGFDVTVDPEQPYLFGIAASGRRRSLPDGELCPEDQEPSPGVLLRPVWQDALLPTLCYVGGPGELSYLALTASLYERFGVPRPLLVPRSSVVIADARVLGLLERFGLEAPDLREGAQAVELRISEAEGAERDAPSSVEDRIEERLRDRARAFRDELRTFDEELAAIDAHLVHPLHRIAKKTQGELDRLAHKIARQRRNRSGRYRQHARRLCAELYPRSSLQERVLPLLPFVARAGEDFVERLLAVLDPFADGQLLVTWD